MNTRLVVAALLLASCQKAEDARTPPAATPPPSDSLSITGDFSTPESVLYDETNDLYLVSNINGQPAGKDDNGFISRVRPDGTIESLKWIDGASPTITLNAPKGLAIHGDTLFVADIDTVRAFSMSSASTVKAWGIPGATFLNDLTTGPDGTLYVSDSGLTPDFKPTGTDAVYRLDATGAHPVVKGRWLANPNGLAAGPEGLTIVPNGGKAVVRIATGSTKADTIATLPGGGVDGVVRRDANNLLASSWETKTVYHIDVVTGAAHPLVTGMESPADIGYDTKRQRVLIPLFMKNRIEVRKAP